MAIDAGLGRYTLSPNGRQLEFLYEELGGYVTRVTLEYRDCRPYCKIDKDFWCDHIAFVIKDNADVTLMAPPEVEWTGMYIEVPMVPTANLWATVIVGELHSATSAYKVYLKLPDGPHADRPFLGFLHKGEGRNTLRGMVYDWFRANIEPETVTCAISAHGFKTQMQVDKDMQSEAGWLKQMWCMWTCDMCTYCRDAMNGIDDLIPGKT